jgi:hypothetical protein
VSRIILTATDTLYEMCSIVALKHVKMHVVIVHINVRSEVIVATNVKAYETSCDTKCSPNFLFFKI